MTKSDTIIELKKQKNCRCYSRKYKGRGTASFDCLYQGWYQGY